jgi:hypothetical protein
MSFVIRDVDVKINWNKFNVHCLIRVGGTAYYNNVKDELAKFNATIGDFDLFGSSTLIFESEAYYHWFLVRWS